MSVEFKAATNFLRSIATAAKVMADALEQTEKDLASAKAAANAHGEFWRLPGAKGSPVTLEGTDTACIQWIRKNARPGSSWDQALADYIVYKDCAALRPELKGPSKAGDTLKDLSGAEQNDLAKNAAEFGSEAKFLDGINVSQILLDHGCIPYRGERLLDRFLAERLKNPAKTCIGAERINEAYQMSILKGIVIIAGEALAIPEYKNDVEIEFISANSEDAKRLPEGAKVMGLLRYSVDFVNRITTGSREGIIAEYKAKKEGKKLIKVVFVGPSKTGKSRNLAALTDVRTFDQTYTPTIGVNFGFYTNPSGTKFQIFDTAGDPRFKSITEAYYRDVDICVLFGDKKIDNDDGVLFQRGAQFIRHISDTQLRGYFDCF